MTEYLLKSSVALAVAYLLYFVFARKNTNFRWLRVYFLTAIAISLILPALKYLPDFHRHDLVSVPAEYVSAWIEDSQVIMVDVPQTALVKAQPPAITLSEIMRYLYGLGAIVLFIRFFIGLSQLVWMVWRNGVQRMGKDYFVLVPELAASFSFFQFIFIDCQYLSTDEHEPILQHERAHVRHWHSVDLLLLEFITMAFWFNPFAWFIRRTLKEIHEFQADEATVRKHISPLDYQHLLLSQVCGVKIYLPANGFNSSLTKKRILMITNHKRNRKWLGIFLLLLVVITSIDSLSRINAAQQVIKNGKGIVLKAIATVYSPIEVSANTHTETETSTNTLIIKSVKQFKKPDSVSLRPQGITPHIIKRYIGIKNGTTRPFLFNGTSSINESNKGCYEFIRKNLRFPESVRKRGMKAIVFIRFDIDSVSGKVINIDCDNALMAKFYREAESRSVNDSIALSFYRDVLNRISDEPLLINEAKRVVALQPNYKLEQTETHSFFKRRFPIRNTVEVHFGDNDIVEGL